MSDNAVRGSEGSECIICYSPMSIRDGDDPTDYCDHCAQELAMETMSLRDELRQAQARIEQFDIFAHHIANSEDESGCYSYIHDRVCDYARRVLAAKEEHDG